jgi:hypothetical protein
MKHLKKYIFFSINESINFDKILTDWKENNNSELDYLRNFSILDDYSLTFSNDKDSKSKTISKFKKIIDKICNDMNIKDITYLGMSNYSTIFLCDDMILKFFSNRRSHSIDEYNMAREFIGKDIPGLVRYYKVWNSEILNFMGKRPGPFYAILMEKCDELTEKEKSLFNRFHKILELDRKSSKITKNDMLEKLKASSNQDELIDDFVNLFFTLKGVVCLDDFRGDNLGRIDGQLIHFDPMDRSMFY